MKKMDIMAQELKVISDFYDFILWLIHHTEKFPRNHRYSLGISVENRLQTILALLLRAKYTLHKAEWLFEANLELDILRFQIRLAKDLKALPVKSHRHAVETLEMIGLQIGSWAKSRERSS
jgi:hypothetical protein